MKKQLVSCGADAVFKSWLPARHSSLWGFFPVLQEFTRPLRALVCRLTLKRPQHVSLLLNSHFVWNCLSELASCDPPAKKPAVVRLTASWVRCELVWRPSSMLLSCFARISCMWLWRGSSCRRTRPRASRDRPTKTSSSLRYQCVSLHVEMCK